MTVPYIRLIRSTVDSLRIEVVDGRLCNQPRQVEVDYVKVSPRIFARPSVSLPLNSSVNMSCGTPHVLEYNSTLRMVHSFTFLTSTAEHEQI